MNVLFENIKFKAINIETDIRTKDFVALEALDLS